MIYIANWKMYGKKHQNLAVNKIIQLSKKKKYKKTKIIYCPPFTLLSDLKKILSYTNIDTGAQNCHEENEYGPFTGGVNCKLIKSAGAKYVILGHSETRNIETNSLINKKIIIALKNKLKVIFCFGETLSEKKKNKTHTIIKNQIKECTKSVVNINNIIFAYEPRWSIGTGKIPKISELNKIFSHIKKTIISLKKKGKKKLIYGGSVNPSNISDLINIKDSTGFLIGNASLSEKKFIDIIKKSTI